MRYFIFYMHIKTRIFFFIYNCLLLFILVILLCLIKVPHGRETRVVSEFTLGRTLKAYARLGIKS